MRRGFRIAIIALLLIAAFASISALADFGDFGGSDDYGGYDSYDSYDYDDDDYDYDSSYSGGSSYSGFNDSPWYIQLLSFGIVIFIIWLVLRKQGLFAKKKGGSSAPRPAGAMPTQDLLPLETIYHWDRNFSADDMVQRLSNLYVQMQNCWQAKNLTPLRGDFTDPQYAQFDRQLDRYRKEGLTNVIERIAVLGVELRGVKRDETHDILVANIRSRVTDYVVSDRTGQVVRGSKTAEKFMEYEWTLVRPTGRETIKRTADTDYNCQNCGAPMNINNSAQCEYCGTVAVKADYDWVIAGIKGLSQRTSS